MKKLFIKAMIKHRLGKGEMIQVTDKLQGIELSKILVEQSLKRNAPILVGNQKALDYFRGLSREIDIYGFADNYTIHLSTRDFPNGVLIDESIADDALEILNQRFENIEVKGGLRK